jgi:polysaccharide chain length determinant protein (PEP-CTERM system associated)
VGEILDLLISYLNALWKRRWIVLVVAWVIAIPGWLIVALIPNIYESSSRIYVDTSSILQPLLKGMAVQPNLQQQVGLMKQTLVSRPNLESVIRKTSYDPAVITDADMEALVTSLQNRTTLLSNKQNLFLISFTDTNAQRAHDVVQALLDIFVEGNLGQNRNDLDAAEQFLDQQIADYEARLEEAESKLASFKQSHMDLTFDGSSYLNNASEAEGQAKKLDEDLKVAIAQRDLVRQQLAAIPETMPAGLSAGGPPDDTQTRIVELQAKLRALLTQYTEKHPDVVSTKRQLDALLAQQQQAQLVPGQGGPGAGPAAASAPTGEPNPFYDQVKLRLMDIDAQIVDLRQRAAAAHAQADAMQSKAQEVPLVQAEFQKLNRDYSVVKARYEELLGRRETTRMSRDRDNIGEAVQFRMIDPPTIPNEPIGPNRRLFLWGVIGAAIGAGLGFALLLTILDTSVATLADLRQYTDLPVLGAVTDTATGTRRIRGVADCLALGSGFAGLFIAVAALLFIERQVGLYNFATAELGDDLFNRGAHLFFKKAADLYSWVKASFVS